MKKIPTFAYYLLIGAILGGYIFFFERGPVKNDADKSKDKKAKLFENYVADDINEVRLENLSTTVNAQKTPVILQKDAQDNWQVTSPHSFKGDDSTIHNLLTAAADYNPNSIIDDPKDLGEFGLNTPSARATFKPKSGNPYVILIGDKSTTGSDYYVKTPNKNTVYMIQGYLMDNLRKDVNEYRDKAFFKTDGVLAKKIEVTRDGKTTVLEKDKDGIWYLTQPIHAKADDQKVKDLLNSVSNLRTTSFPDDHPSNLKIYGLAPPHASITVWPSDGKEPNVLLLGREKLKANQYFAKSGSLPYVYTVGSFFDGTLNIKLMDYRDKSMMHYDASSARSIVVKHNGMTYVYQKDDKGNWACPARPKAQEEANYINNALSGTVISDFASKSDSTGLSKPSYVIEVDLASNTKRVYRYGSLKKDTVFLASDQVKKEVYLTPSNIIGQLDSYYSQILTPVPTVAVK